MFVRRFLILSGILSCGTAVHGQTYCPERNARYATTQCDAYIECVDGIPNQKLCPDGLLFNPGLSYAKYPCQYPNEVTCEGRTALQPAKPTKSCRHQFGYYRLGDASHCGQFLNCANGQGHVFDCPEGLAFNEITYQCDWPDQVSTCDAESYLGFTCPRSADESAQYYPNPVDCRKYFGCINNRPRLYSCSPNDAFNPYKGACDDIANVTTCLYPTIRRFGS